jgi:hypothetical protein
MASAQVKRTALAFLAVTVLLTIAWHLRGPSSVSAASPTSFHSPTQRQSVVAAGEDCVMPFWRTFNGMTSSLEKRPTPCSG